MTTKFEKSPKKVVRGVATKFGLTLVGCTLGCILGCQDLTRSHRILGIKTTKTTKFY